MCTVRCLDAIAPPVKLVYAAQATTERAFALTDAELPTPPDVQRKHVNARINCMLCVDS
jgi:hypothetical protein